MKIKNVAIIAHVDHGKTTLVNKLIESGIKDKHHKLEDRILDSNDLEKERGITILAKNTAIYYKDHKINILDTPGHADFGGEVERIMHMVDGVLLVVDAFEGVMPQTRFVLSKALEKNIKPIVIINKVDRDAANPKKALDEVYDLFIDLGAEIEDLDFPVIYGSALKGIMGFEDNNINNDISIILDTIIKTIDEPKSDINKPFLFQPSLIDYNEYVGRMGIGKIYQGSVSVSDDVVAVRENDELVKFRVQKIYQNIGIEKVEVKEAYAGDIVSIAGLSDIMVGESINAINHKTKLPSIEIGNPTVEINFSTNNSPFVGRDGSNVTSTKLINRLKYESNKDVSLKVTTSDEKETWIVAGRGELHLSILIENMRREGFEFQVSKPRVVLKHENGKTLEPYELVYVEVPSETSGTVIEVLSERGAKLNKMNVNNNYTKMEYIAPSRSLIGFMTIFLTITKGYGIINHSFYSYKEVASNVNTERNNGVLIANMSGFATEYAIKRLEDRGVMFVEPRTEVYEGMIVGENNKQNDLVINITQERPLNNIRQAHKDQTVVLKRPKLLTLEQSLSFINNDELVEITPKTIRIRKKLLKEYERKRYNKIWYNIKKLGRMNYMKVAIGSDHAGYLMKENIKKHLESKNIEVVDLGAQSEESVDYPEFGKKVGEAVTSEPYDFGVVVCGTGIGISIAANKVKGVRAALVYDTNTARLAKEHNKANILAIGGRTTTFEDANDIIDAYMDAKFEERHQKRIDIISNLEEEKKWAKYIF